MFNNLKKIKTVFFTVQFSEHQKMNTLKLLNYVAR